MSDQAVVVSGRDLRVGDSLGVWWIPEPRRDQIISIRPYAGPLAHLWPEGAVLVDFASGPGMSVGLDDRFRVWR